MNGNQVYAVITAAGAGTRLGYARPKALVELAGKPLVSHAVERFLQHPEIAGVVVTAPAEKEYFNEFQRIFDGDKRVLLVEGGVSRQASVYLGLQAIPELAAQLQHQFSERNTLVLIHDAARCLTPNTVISRVIKGLKEQAKAVVPAMQVVDTLSEFMIEGTSGLEFSKGSIDRAKLRAVQTPQGFHYEVIVSAHALGKEKSAEAEFTDDASLMRLVEQRVLIVAGSEQSLKITTPLDLAVAQTLLNLEAGAATEFE